MSGHSFTEEYDQENKAFQNQPEDKEKIVSLAWSSVRNRKILLYTMYTMQLQFGNPAAAESFPPGSSASVSITQNKVAAPVMSYRLN